MHTLQRLQTEIPWCGIDFTQLHCLQLREDMMQPCRLLKAWRHLSVDELGVPVVFFVLGAVKRLHDLLAQWQGVVKGFHGFRSWVARCETLG